MRVSWTLYDDIVIFLQKHKERLSGDELTTLDIVAGGYLVNEELTRKVIDDARSIMARHERSAVGSAPRQDAHGIARDFDRGDRAAIEDALADPDAENPVAKAIAERLKELTGCYWAHAETLGSAPQELLLVKPQTAFDEIVYRLHLQTIADATGKRVTVVWVQDEAETISESVAAE